jgi:hypothetical protein
VNRWLRPLLHPDAPARKTAEATYRAGQFVVTSSLRPLRNGSRRFPEVPTRITTPAVASLAYLVELATVTFPRVRFPRDPELVAEAEEHRVKALAAIEAQGWDRDPTRFHADPAAPERVVTGKRTSNLVRYDLIRYDSDFQPPAGLPELEAWDGLAANSRAGAYVLRHRGGPRPWLVNVHGYTAGNATDLTAMRALYFHRNLGLNVIHPVLPFHGFRRTSARGAAGFFSYDHVHNLYAYAQTVWDVRRAVAWVRSQDPVWVGVHGVSLGGYVTALVASLPGAPDRAIAGIPFADVVWATNRRLPPQARAVDADELGRLYRPVTPTAMDCLVPFDGRFVYGAVADRITKPGQAVALWKHWDEPAVCWFTGSHLSALWSRQVHHFVTSALQM